MRDYHRCSCVSLPMKTCQHSRLPQPQHELQPHWKFQQQQQQHEQQQQQYSFHLQQQQQDVNILSAGHNAAATGAAAAADVGKAAPDRYCTSTAHVVGAGETAGRAGPAAQLEGEIAAPRVSQTTATERGAAIAGATVEGRDAEEALFRSSGEKEYYVWDPVLQEYKQTDTATGEALLHDPQYTQCHFRLVDDVVEEMRQPSSQQPQQQQHRIDQQQHEQQQFHSQHHQPFSQQQQVHQQQQFCHYAQPYTQPHLQPQHYEQRQEQKSYRSVTIAAALSKQRGEGERTAQAAAAAPTTHTLTRDPTAAVSCTADLERRQPASLCLEQQHDIHKLYNQLRRQSGYNVTEQQGQADQHQQSDSVQQLRPVLLPPCTGSSSFPLSVGPSAVTAAASSLPTVHTLRCPASAASTSPAATYPFASARLAAAPPPPLTEAANTRWNCRSSAAAPTGACGNSSTCPYASLVSSVEYASRYPVTALCSATTAAVGAFEMKLRTGGPLSTAATAPGTPSTAATAAAIPFATAATPLPPATAETTFVFSAQKGALGTSLHSTTAAAASASLLALAADAAANPPCVRPIGAETAAPEKAATTRETTAATSCAAGHAYFCGEATECSTAATPAAAEKLLPQPQLAQRLSHCCCCCCRSSCLQTCCCGSCDQREQLQQTTPCLQQQCGFHASRSAVLPVHYGSRSSSASPAAAVKAATAASAAQIGQNFCLPVCCTATSCRCCSAKSIAFASPCLVPGCPVAAAPSTRSAGGRHASSSNAAAPSLHAAQLPVYPAAAFTHSLPLSAPAATAERLCESSNIALTQSDRLGGFRTHHRSDCCCCSNGNHCSCCLITRCCARADSCCYFAADACHPACCSSAKSCCAQTMKRREDEEVAEQAAATTVQQQCREAQQDGGFSCAKPSTEQLLQTAAERAAVSDYAGLTTATTTAATLAAEAAPAAGYEALRSANFQRYKVDREITNASCTAPSAACGGTASCCMFAAEETSRLLGMNENPELQSQPQQQEQWQTQPQQKEGLLQQKEVPQQQQWEMHERAALNAASGACSRVWGEVSEEKMMEKAEDYFLLQQQQYQQQQALWWNEAAVVPSIEETGLAAVDEDDQEERELLLESFETLQIPKRQQHAVLKQPFISTRMSTSRPWGEFKKAKGRSASLNVPTVSTPSAAVTADAALAFDGGSTAIPATTTCAEAVDLFAAATVNSPSVVAAVRPGPAAARSGRGAQATIAAAAGSMDRRARVPNPTSALAARMQAAEGRNAAAAAADVGAVIGKATAKAAEIVCTGRGGGQRVKAAVRAGAPLQAHASPLPSHLQQRHTGTMSHLQVQHERDAAPQQEQQSDSALQQHQEAQRTAPLQQQQQRRAFLQQQRHILQPNGSFGVQQQQQRQGAGRRATYHPSSSTDNNAVAAATYPRTDFANAAAAGDEGEPCAVAGACDASSWSDVAKRPLSSRTISTPARAAAARKEGAKIGRTTFGVANGRGCLQQLIDLHKDEVLSFHAAARDLHHEKALLTATAMQQGRGRAAASSRTAAPAAMKKTLVAAAQRRRAQAAGVLRSLAMQHESSRSSRVLLSTGVGASSSSRPVTAANAPTVSVSLPSAAAGATGGVRSSGGATSKTRLPVAAVAAVVPRRRLHDPVTRGKQLRAAWQEDPLVNKKNTFDVVAYEAWLRNNGHLLRARALELHQEEQRLLQLLQQQTPYNF